MPLDEDVRRHLEAMQHEVTALGIFCAQLMGLLREQKVLAPEMEERLFAAMEGAAKIAAAPGLTALLDVMRESSAEMGPRS